MLLCPEAPVKLYVCWSTPQRFRFGRVGHPCANAYRALRRAGHAPDVVHAHSLGLLPGFMQTTTRKLVQEKTGRHGVPALETTTGSGSPARRRSSRGPRSIRLILVAATLAALLAPVPRAAERPARP